MLFQNIDHNQLSFKIIPCGSNYEHRCLATILEGCRDGIKSRYGKNPQEALNNLIESIQDTDEFVDARISIHKRYFIKNIFLGSGAFSVSECNLLHKKLDAAISLLGGMQQNGLMGTDFDKKSDEEGTAQMQIYLDDINAALKT